LEYFIKSEIFKNVIVLLCAFFVFVGLVHPKPLWGAAIYDELFKTKGIRLIRDHLRTHIKENDIIINATIITELRAELGDALNLIPYKFYLNEFFSKHSLEELPLRTGRVGLWLILKKPLKNDNLVPFYFPGTYSPKIVEQVKDLYLYYGEINIPVHRNLKNDIHFTTPFWSFFTGIILQSKREINLAKEYYNLAIKHNFNVDRINYNLSLLYLWKLEKALDYMEKAIKTIETPTIVPENIEVKSWRTYGKDERNLPNVAQNLNSLRYIYLKRYGIQYKKWFVEDFIKDMPSFYAGYYLNAIFYAKRLYSMTRKEIYLKKIKSFYERGRKITEGKIPELVEETYIKAKKGVFYKNHLTLTRVHELYPPINRN